MSIEVYELPTLQLMDDDFHNMSAKRSARKAARKQKRAARKLSKHQRKEERRKRKAERKAKRGKGAKLTPEEVIDEALDIEEAKADGDSVETKDLVKDAKDSDSEKTTDDNGGDGKIMGMPKTAFYIGVGVIAIVGGFIVYKKFIAKK